MTEPSLTDFLLARIAKDKALAQAVAETHSALQSVETDTPIRPDAPQWALDTRTFVNTWDPARVLAESEAKRRIIEAAPWANNGGHSAMKDLPGRWILRLLAAVYADHPDYDESWQPDQ
jgi:hypothetical protein